MSVDVLYVYLCFICKKSKILFTPLQASPLRCGHVSGKMIKVRTESQRVLESPRLLLTQCAFCAESHSQYLQGLFNPHGSAAQS